MKASDRWVIAAALCVAGVLAWKALSGGLALLGTTDGEQIARAEQVVAQSARVTSSTAHTSVDAGRSPTSTSAYRLQTLYAKGGHPIALAREASAADDAVLWVRALDLWRLCTHTKIAPPVDLAELRKIYEQMKPPPDPRQSERLIAMTQRMRDQPPQRLALPDSWGQIVRDWFESKSGADDNGVAPLLDAALIAPQSDTERSAHGKLIEAVRATCSAADASSEDFFNAYRSGRDRWFAQGATSTLLQDKRAGWTSLRLNALSDRDYELVDRIVRERQPDGLARLLSIRNTLELNLIGDRDQLEPRVQLATLGLAPMVATLASCELGVESCSANSPAFIEYCLTYGGCHQPDVASLARYALARDGLDPAWAERESARVVRAVWAGDLAALGIFRKDGNDK